MIPNFVQKLLLMLDDAGFDDVTVEGRYGGRPATPDDAVVVFVARQGGQAPGPEWRAEVFYTTSETRGMVEER